MKFLLLRGYQVGFRTSKIIFQMALTKIKIETSMYNIINVISIFEFSLTLLSNSIQICLIIISLNYSSQCFLHFMKEILTGFEKKNSVMTFFFKKSLEEPSFSGLFEFFWTLKSHI